MSRLYMKASVFPATMRVAQRILSSSSSLARHIRNGHGPVTVLCLHPGCESVFRSEERLRSHMKKVYDHTPPLINLCPLADREGPRRRLRPRATNLLMKMTPSVILRLMTVQAKGISTGCREFWPPSLCHGPFSLLTRSRNSSAPCLSSSC